MTKAEFFRQNMKEIAIKIGIKEDLIIRRDNRLGNYLACVKLHLYKGTKEPVYLIRYNDRLLQSKNEGELLHLILHELGHISLKHHYQNGAKDCNKLIQFEYEAEKFSLEYIYKYHNEYFKSIIKDMEENIDKWGYIYKEAFVRILAEFN